MTRPARQKKNKSKKRWAGPSAPGRAFSLSATRVCLSKVSRVSVCVSYIGVSVLVPCPDLESLLYVPSSLCTVCCFQPRIPCLFLFSVTLPGPKNLLYVPSSFVYCVLLPVQNPLPVFWLLSWFETLVSVTCVTYRTRFECFIPASFCTRCECFVSVTCVPTVHDPFLLLLIVLFL